MHTQATHAEGRGFAIDTTFVLFFLAMDFGQSVFSFGLDGFFSAITLLMLIVLPYLLPAAGEKPEFTGWVFGRFVIASFAIVLGAMFKQTLGVVLPDTFRFLPMTFLIAAGMISCYIQFYGIMKFRLAR
jgi:hypothetical protein